MPKTRRKGRKVRVNIRDTDGTDTTFGGTNLGNKNKEKEHAKMPSNEKIVGRTKKTTAGGEPKVENPANFQSLLF